jgi:hypothetical protein
MDIRESVRGCQGNAEAVRTASFRTPLVCTESALASGSPARSSSAGECGVYPHDPMKTGTAAAQTLILVSTFMDSVWSQAKS